MKIYFYNIKKPNADAFRAERDWPAVPRVGDRVTITMTDKRVWNSVVVDVGWSDHVMGGGPETDGTPIVDKPAVFVGLKTGRKLRSGR